MRLEPCIQCVVAAGSSAATNVNAGMLSVRPGVARGGASRWVGVSVVDARHTGSEGVAKISLTTAAGIASRDVIEMNAVGTGIVHFDDCVLARPRAVCRSSRTEFAPR